LPARRARSRISHTTGSENVYADLGYAAPDDMHVKARLVTRIAQLLKERGLTQIDAAKIVGVPQPKLSRLLRGQFRGFSERKLIDCLTRLGSDVRIVVVEPARRRSRGTLTVVFTADEPR
jgi:predicted XRE-type DNA-binding protein